MEISKKSPKRRVPMTDTGEYDFIKDAPNIIRGNFPRMLRMKRRLILEATATLGLAVTAGWMHDRVPGSTPWMTAVLVGYGIIFIGLQIRAFRAYWYTPSDIDYGTALKKISRRYNQVTGPMKTMSFLLLFFNLVMLIIEGLYTPFLTVQILLPLLLLQAAIGFFSRRWISDARWARSEAAKFSPDSI